MVNFLVKFALGFVTLAFVTGEAFAQKSDSTLSIPIKKVDSVQKNKVDSLSSKTKVANKNALSKIFQKKDSVAKPPRSPVTIAARKAAFRSLIIPGFGQVTNILAIKGDKERLQLQGKSFALKKIFISAKIVGIYTAESMLVYSFLSNKKDIRDFNAELAFRNQNEGAASPNGIYKDIQTPVLQAAKTNAIRNRDVSTFGFIAVHALNAIDAYIDARLRFFNVDDDLSFQITPTIVSQPQAWTAQYQYYPALKITLKL